MRIMGIDPGLRFLGWGVIETSGSRLRHVANGTCRSEGTDLAQRLVSLHRQLTEVVETYRPDAASIEMTFVNRDGAGTLKLGQARGVAVLVPASAGIPVAEYAPNAVKKTVVGAGHADKRQIDHMVRMQLPGVKPAGPDAADALALALCHAFHARGTDRLARALGASGAAV
jgi:crossover junction endodeoxyribonuclease RuvC